MRYPKRLILKWYSIKSRCYKEDDPSYKNYGARGIKMCHLWESNRETFLKWSMENGWEKGLHIDRLDNDGDYEPNNCRYISHYENQHNTRIKKTNTSGYTGVSYVKPKKAFRAYITAQNIHGKKSIHIGLFKTKEEAVTARNKYITDNNLPHKIREI